MPRKPKAYPRISFRIFPPALLSALVRYVHDHKVSYGAVIRAALTAYLHREES